MLVNALQDAALVPKQKYSCLQLLESRTVVERITASLYFSYVRRLQTNSPGSCIVLDCRAREHVNSNSYLLIVQKLKAVVMAEHIPPHQQCSVDTREAVKKWLQINCNLKHVFLMDAYPAKTSLHGNNMLTRVLKYLGLSQACPVRVCLLDCGMHEASRSRIPISLLKIHAPVNVALVAKKTAGDALYVFPHEFLKAPNAIESAIAELNVRYVLNLTRTPTGLQGARELGGSKLPLKSSQDSISFITSAVEYLLCIPNSANVLIVDTHLNKIASELLVSLLILEGKCSYEKAIRITRDRLCPPEFDSFAKAAFMLLAETQGTHKARMEVAFAQFAGRFDPDHDLKATTRLSTADRWQLVEKMLDGKATTEYAPIIEIITKLSNNILMHPEDNKYKKFRVANPRIAKAFSLMPELGRQILETGGWVSSDDRTTYEFKGSPQQLRDLLVYMNSSI